MKEKLNKKFKSLITNKKFLIEFRFWMVMIMIMVFGFVTQKMINKSMIEYMIACGGLLVIDMLIYKLVDLQVELLILDEIIFNNEKLAGSFNKLVKEEHEIHRLAAKYERCWKLLKKGCEMSNNNALGNYLDELEKLVEPEVDDIFNNIYKEKKK